jgi:O-antigen/teichoic acid export membrane protein
MPSRSISTNLLASWSVYLVRVLIGFVLMPFVIHVLGDTQYGFWIFINSIAGYAGLMYLGFGTTVSRFVARHYAAREWSELNKTVSFVTAVYGLMACVALLLTAGLVIFAPSLSDWEGHSLTEIRIVIFLLGINVAIGLVGSVFGGILIGARRFDLERLVYFLSDIGRLILLMVFLRREWGLVVISCVYVAMTIFENLAYALLSWRIIPHLSVRWRHLNWETFRNCFSFSSFAFLNALAGQLIYSTDTVVIGSCLGAASIVPYFIALRLCQIIKQPVEQISEVCMPTAGALQAQFREDHMRALMVRAVGLSLLLTSGMFIGCIFFSPLLLDLWMGPGYDQTYPLLLVLFSAQVVALPVGVLRAFLFGTGHVRLPSLIYLAEAVANLLLSIILCFWLKNLGVALGTAIPILLFELFIILPYGLKTLKIPAGHLIREGILPQAIPLAALLVYSAAVHHSLLPNLSPSWTTLVGIAIGGGMALGLALLVQLKLTTTGRFLVRSLSRGTSPGNLRHSREGKA